MERQTVDFMAKRIAGSSTFEQLRQYRDELHNMFTDPLHVNPPLELTQYLNEIHDLFIQRTIVLSEQQLSDRGMGPPPVSYAFVLFGSGGRSEQTLWSDQDHGLLFANPPAGTEERVEAYFHQLVFIIADGLGQLGYPPCEGDVLSTNPLWRKSADGWLRMMADWMGDPVWENVRYLLILADMRFLYGDRKLVTKFKYSFFEAIKGSPHILQIMLQNTLHHKITLGVFGQLITERYGDDAGGIDIKYGAYIPFVNGIRLLAIQAGIMETSTADRISILGHRNQLKIGIMEDWIRAFALIVSFRFNTSFEMSDRLYTTSGKIQAEHLTKDLRDDLKYALRTGRDLQRYVKKTIED